MTRASMMILSLLVVDALHEAKHAGRERVVSRRDFPLPVFALAPPQAPVTA